MEIVNLTSQITNIVDSISFIFRGYFTFTSSFIINYFYQSNIIKKVLKQSEITKQVQLESQQTLE